MNACNPYDFAGALHNYLLANCNTITLHTYNQSGDMSLPLSITISNQILSDYGFDTLYNRVNTTMIWQNLDNFFVDYFQNLKSQPCIQDAMLRIISGVYQLALDHVSDYASYKKYIAAEEEKILNDDYFSDEEQVILLTTTSVLRHSLYYWHTFDFNIVPSKGLPKWAKWAIVGVADAAGAVGGALAGATAGSAAASVIPGIGTSVGAAAGAVAGSVTGAVSASNGATALCEKIDKLIDEKVPETNNNNSNNGGN